MEGSALLAGGLRIFCSWTGRCWRPWPALCMVRQRLSDGGQADCRCSAPEINGPVVQQEFTSLLRETCHRAPPATAGAAASNDRRAVAGVSRGRSTESYEPGNEDTGWTHNSGRAELDGQTRPSMVLTWSDEAERPSSPAAITVAEKECCSNPQGPSGTAVRGPACTVVWEAGGEIPPPTRLGSIKRIIKIFLSLV